MRPGTGARSDRFSATLARILILAGAVLAAIGLAALVFHVTFPLWAWVVTGPDMLTLTMLAAARMVTPRPLFRPFGT